MVTRTFKQKGGSGYQFLPWKPFNALRPVHGFPQVLPLDTFNDYKDGYAFDGNQWEFSVDVMVPLTNWEVVSFTQKPSKPDFCWTVNKFSKLKEHRYGHVVVSQGRDYIRSQIDIHLSEVKPDKDTLKAGEQIYTKADVRILTHLESLDKEVFGGINPGLNTGNDPPLIERGKMREGLSQPQDQQ
ncbi:hypothetical protein F2Q68_00016884 [Brassica cretica]|uniref:MATH domain-containing protein n=1 Tax=Brassica cretica TaxID=69181 RepID=A0A8S9HEK4_BRACR|nr:hypothetical protein F2Q68_00016884 [Brassica cretica]